MRRRVVVTGMGCVSPVGNDPASAWKTVLAGKSGIGKITRFDATGFASQIAGEVRDFDLAKWFAPDVASSFDLSGLNIKFGVAAAMQAVRDAGLQDGDISDPTRLGVYIGSGEGIQKFQDTMELIALARDGSACDIARFSDGGLKRFCAESEATQEPSVLSARIAGLFDAQGPNMNTLTACAASAQAIGEGSQLIRENAADVLIVGGAHSMIHPFGITGFTLLTTLSTWNDQPTKASRPFDQERNGFVIAEGAAMLILEEYEHARRRGATIYGELLGYGTTADAYRVTDLPPDGHGMSRAMTIALNDASLTADKISYVNAHGTSTKANDRTETVAIKAAFGSHASNVPISSTKSMTGHLVAACGALESMFSLQALAANAVPPTANYEFPDPECDLDYIPQVARDVPLTYVMSNNSGFGGQNVSLVWSRV